MRSSQMFGRTVFASCLLFHNVRCQHTASELAIIILRLSRGGYGPRRPFSYPLSVIPSSSIICSLQTVSSTTCPSEMSNLPSQNPSDTEIGNTSSKEDRSLYTHTLSLDYFTHSAISLSLLCVLATTGSQYLEFSYSMHESVSRAPAHMLTPFSPSRKLLAAHRHCVSIQVKYLNVQL